VTRLEAIGKLLEGGYTLQHFRQGHIWLITKPDGTMYTAKPAERTCTCPAVLPCKHLKVVRALEQLGL